VLELPYRTIEDLPPAVRKLPTAEQRQWMAVFNKVYAEQGEEAAFRIAWGVVRKRHHDDEA